jgi:hypothetical protein
VTFSYKYTILGTAQTSNGKAAITTTFTQAKSYAISATYGGDSTLAVSKGNTKQVVTN